MQFIKLTLIISLEEPALEKFEALNKLDFGISLGNIIHAALKEPVGILAIATKNISLRKK